MAEKYSTPGGASIEAGTVLQPSVPMQVSNGGRFELKLQQSDALGAHYLAEFQLPQQRFEVSVQVDPQTGHLTWSEQPGRPEDEVPAWLVKYAAVALRTAWRAHQNEGWPRRLTRWRAEPTPSERDSSKPSTP